MRVAIIPARGGSRRIPRKNIRPFHGKPIIAYSIEAAQNSRIFDRVWVSTEDTEIAEVAIAHGAHVLYRPAALAKDEVGTQEVMQHAVVTLGVDDIACCIYPCAPLLTYQTLWRARDALLDEKRHRAYVVPVGVWLRDPGQFYMGKADCFRHDIPLLGPDTALLPVDADTDCDINTEEDWARAEQLFEKRKAA